MPRETPEADWQLFRKLHAVALERFCQRVLSEVDRLTSDQSQSTHARYLALFELIQRRNQELADAFDNPRRSTALTQLMYIASHQLLTEAELAGFSPKTRQSLEAYRQFSIDHE